MKLELEEIYKTYFQDVYYFVLAMSKDPHIAEEITQETFFKALKGVKHFQGKCSIKSWLCQIARNEYISYSGLSFFRISHLWKNGSAKEHFNLSLLFDAHSIVATAIE